MLIVFAVQYNDLSIIREIVLSDFSLPVRRRNEWTSIPRESTIINSRNELSVFLFDDSVHRTIKNEKLIWKAD